MQLLASIEYYAAHERRMDLQPTLQHISTHHSGMVLFCSVLTLKQFRCCVRWTTTEGLQLRVFLKLVTEAKVGDFHVEISVKQQILCLKVINIV